MTPPGIPILPQHELARWLPNDTPGLNRRIVKRALLDIGICEVPPGSNRSGVIDEYNLAAKVPAGSYWCASAVAAWWRDAGAEVPEYPAGCDEWMKWAKATRRWSTKPVPGAAIVYGKPTDANHIGVIVRVSPITLAVEGNTSLSGSFDRNGIAVALKVPDLKRVLGYVHPRPL